MIMAATIAAGLCLLSVAAGFTARALLASEPRRRRRPALAAGRVSGLVAADRWRPLARTLLWPDRFAACLVAWLAFVDAVLALAAPWPLKVVVDYAVGHHGFPASLAWMSRLTPPEVAAAAAAAGLVLLLAGAVAGYLVTFLTSAVTERMTVRLRSALAEHIVRAEPRCVAAYPLGELTSRLGGDTVRVSGTVAAIVETIPDTALLAGMVVITAALDWRLTLIALAIIPLYALTARFRNRALRGAQQRARARSGDLATFTAGLLTRLPAVHVFDRAADEIARHREACDRSARAEVAAIDAGARFAPVTDTLPGLALAAALVAGTAEVTSGRITIGGFLVFLAYLSSLTGPVRSLARLSATIARGTASRDRIAELLRLPQLRTAAVTAAAAPSRGPLRARGPAISLDRVSYAHRGGHPVLESATLDVPAGELVCLTGPSGGGKSTLLSLLVRLADAQSGRITIGGRDLAGIPLDQLRALVCLVPQDPWLHTGTIEANIGYGRAGATKAQILAAAERAGVADFAPGLPDGYQTPVGEGGYGLSGGQRRRIAVARALLRDTPALLLDEPTTGLDPAAEARLIARLLDVARGKTVILVSHQPALIERAEHVVRLCDGRITPAGMAPAGMASSPDCSPALPPARGPEGDATVRSVKSFYSSRTDRGLSVSGHSAPALACNARRE
jgi:ATP-binding cassette, subfamily B, bacterial